MSLRSPDRGTTAPRGSCPHPGAARSADRRRASVGASGATARAESADAEPPGAAPGKPGPRVCVLAAESDLIPGGKVGGLGDVIRDLPPALAREGASIAVVVPAYGSFHERPDAHLARRFSVPFGGSPERIELYRLEELSREGVTQYVLHHSLFAACGAGRIYCDDPPERPFARDATKFALFSVAALVAIRDGHLGATDVLHLHDTWGAGLANVTEALRQGVTHFDVALGGTGGCPFIPGATGNIPTEDTARLLDGLGVATGVDAAAGRRAPPCASATVTGNAAAAPCRPCGADPSPLPTRPSPAPPSRCGPTVRRRRRRVPPRARPSSPPRGRPRRAARRRPPTRRRAHPHTPPPRCGAPARVAAARARRLPPTPPHRRPRPRRRRRCARRAWRCLRRSSPAPRAKATSPARCAGSTCGRPTGATTSPRAPC